MQPNELIIQVQQKNERAFQQMYAMYSENIFGVIYAVLKDEALSEEVLQDVFIKIWNNSTSYSEKKGRFFTWILNIARNAAIDKTRSKSYKNAKQNQSDDYFVDILEEKSSFSHKIDAIGVQKYIDSLEPLCKNIIDLLFFKGYTQKEASKALEIPLGTIKTRNRSCIKTLRKTLAV